MGLLVWLMHCDLLRLAVYLLRVQNEKKRGGALVFEGKPEQDEVKPGRPEEIQSRCVYSDWDKPRTEREL